MDKYRVTLTDEERDDLKAMVTTGKGAARKIAHSRILLRANDAHAHPRANEDIEAALGCSLRTVACVRQQLVTQGIDVALCRKP